MRAIEVTINVSPDGTVDLEGTPDLPPGKHHALLVVDKPHPDTTQDNPKPPLEFHISAWEGWPADCTYRREDIYGDDGR